MTDLSPQVRAVIFDFGGVLSFPPTGQDWQALAEIVGVPLSAFHQEYWRERDDYDVDRFDSAAYWRRVGRAFGRELTGGDIQKLTGLDNQQWVRENANSMAVVRAARAAGLKIAVLSNMHSDLLSYVRQSFPWFGEFDVQVFSCESGMAKPSLASFVHTAKLLGVCPEEILVVDDRQPNLDGAARAGMKTLLFDSPEAYRKLEQVLLDLGAPLERGSRGR